MLSAVRLLNFVAKWSLLFSPRSLIFRDCHRNVMFTVNLSKERFDILENVPNRFCAESQR